MSFQLTVVRLPGAGMISNGTKSSIPWLAYREQRINSNFYKNLFVELASRGGNEKFAIISGGLGSHLYVNLARELGLTELEIGGVARRHIFELQEILKLSATSKALKVHKLQVPLEALQSAIGQSESNVFFVEPSPNHSSTDDLAADAARLLAATRLIYFKSRAPHYTVGFESETTISKWSLDDLMERARLHEDAGGGSYVLTKSSVEIIKRSNYEVIILPPEATGNMFRAPDPKISTVLER